MDLKQRKEYYILDWNNDLCFYGKLFISVSEAENYLKEVIDLIGLNYNKERKEYRIIEKLIQYGVV